MAENDTGTVAPVTPEATGPQGSLSAYDRMLAFLNQEDKPAGAEATGEEEIETSNPKPEGAEADEGEELEAEEAEGDESEEAEAESEDDEDGEEQAAEPVYTVKVDGKEEQVKLDELLAGYSRTADYTRKTQEVANQRKELEQASAELVQERQEYLQLLPKLRELISHGEQEPDWEALSAADPVQALVAKQRWDARQKRIAQLTEEQNRVSEKEQERIEKEQQAYLAKQREILLADPETAHWADQAKRQADAAMIANTMLAAGFDKSELMIFDSRALKLAYKAALYDKSQEGRKRAEEQVRKKAGKSPVIKAGSPAGKPKGASQKAFTRLAKTGSKSDAQAWFEANL